MTTRLETFNKDYYALEKCVFWTGDLAEAAYYISSEFGQLIDRRKNEETGEYEVQICGNFYYSALSEKQQKLEREKVKKFAGKMAEALRDLQEKKKGDLS